ncbi:hypothetical protein C8Q73DRAFT_718731 [Cubamyces lactineus]|nr:hypothetical protein C8Q73DRAFT_718731 [Cubamyces lactineus]
MPHSIHNGPDIPAFHPSLHHQLPYPSPHDSQPSPQDPPPALNSPSLPKKKHVCQICARAFTTSGHLSRHTRIHTGERNHKCPFPGCETRCSRQDNLQQQSVFSLLLSSSLLPPPCLPGPPV